MNTIKLLLASLRLKVAIHKANLMHKSNGKRYYVLPSIQRGKLLILCKQDINALKRAKVIRKSYTHLDVMTHCLYYTADINGNNKSKMSSDLLDKNKKLWIKHIKHIFNINK